MVFQRFKKNDVQEDSFQLELRSKTNWVPTNAFLSSSDADLYNAKCPIDPNFVNGSTCSGTYVNGGFTYYPPFNYQGCQCQAILNGITGSYSLPTNYVNEELQQITVTGQTSPCVYLLQNETRSKPEKPNVWSEMNTTRLNVTVRKIPPGGEVRMISSFSVNFWLNQEETDDYLVTEVNTEKSFRSTNEVYIFTRCTNGLTTCGTFELDYQRIKLEAEVDDFPDWSIYITIYIGFSLMFIAFIYFEWRELLKCFKRCQQKACGRAVPVSQIHYMDGEVGKDDRTNQFFEEGEQVFQASQDGSISGEEDLVIPGSKGGKTPDQLYSNYKNHDHQD